MGQTPIVQRSRARIPPPALILFSIVKIAWNHLLYISLIWLEEINHSSKKHHVVVGFLTVRRTLIVLLILSVCLVTPAQAYFEAFTVSAFSQAVRKVELQLGETIIGTVRSKGAGQNDSINFYVTDSDGNTVLRYDNKSDISFSFTTSITENYTLHFDNTHFTIAKGITLKYSTELQIFGIPQDLFYSILVVLVIAVIMIIAAVIFVLRRRRHIKQQEIESLKAQT